MLPIKTIRKTTTLSRSARVLTYYFNALIDAELSYELVQILKEQTGKSSLKKSSLREVQQRAQNYLQLALDEAGNENQTNDISFQVYLAGLAYNLYYANGLANWLYAQLFRPFLTRERRFLVDRYLTKMKSQLMTPFVFQEFISKHYAVSYWPTIVTKQEKWVEEFSKSYQLGKDIGLTDEVLKKTAHLVQAHNSQFNRRVAEWLLEGSGPNYQKLELLRAAAKESKREKRFIKTCARVQRAAARWDGLYRRLVRE